MPEYKWSPIKNLSSDLINFSDTELRAFEEEWKLVREQLSKATVVELIEQMKREWAIETGKIENLYTLDEGITETLIEHGIVAKYISHNSTNRDPEELEAILLDHQNVIESLFDFIAGRQELSLHYIRAMHQVFTEHQYYTTGQDQEGNRTQIALIKGAWKKFPNNPKQPDGTIHEYCPPESVQLEMEKLMAFYHGLKERESIAPEVLAAWLHHRFTQIHPFQDGNGRIARALATLVFLKSGDFPLLVTNKVRSEYIDALEAADFGDLNSLIQFFADIQKDRLYDAILKAQDVAYDYSNDVVKNEKIEDFYKKKNVANNIIKEFSQIAFEEISTLKKSLISSNLFGINFDANIRKIITDKNDKLYYQLRYEPTLEYSVVVQIECFLNVNKKEISDEIDFSMHFKSNLEIQRIILPITDDSRLKRLQLRGWIKEVLIRLNQSFFSNR